MRTVPNHLSRFISPINVWCDGDRSLREASTLMDQRKLSHLPVKDEKGVRGIVNRRDICLLQKTIGSAYNLYDTLDLLFGAPLIMDIETPMEKVVGEMGRRCVDAAFISDAGNIIGYLTLHSALESLLSIQEITQEAI